MNPNRTGRTMGLLPYQIAQQAGRDRELGEREPGGSDLVHRGAAPVALVLAPLDPGLPRRSPGDAVAAHGGGEAALGVADRIERAVERQPVEIVRDVDGARGARDAVEAEEGFGREI